MLYIDSESTCLCHPSKEKMFRVKNIVLGDLGHSVFWVIGVLYGCFQQMIDS